MRNSLKRVLAIALAVMMLVGIVPMSTSAAGVDVAETSLTDASVNFGDAGLTVITDVDSNLAPGITLNEVAVYDKNGNRVEMFIATADTTVDTVKIQANYKDNNNSVYGMQKTTDQVAAAEANHEEPYNVVAAINASYYNTSTGKPTGAFVMEGVDVTNEAEGNNYAFFAVLKDGTHMIGAKGEYSSYKGQIEEAIGGYIHIVKDGAVVSGLNSTDKYPRQTLGIREDGKVIIMTADGNQAPKSDGLTIKEQAEVMLAMGCVEAIHLDGGGSATFCAKREGTDEFKVLNSPSNGSERAVSNTLMFVSTAVADGTFDHANLTADKTNVTPNSTVTVSAIGVDAAGGVAEIPENATWQLADSTFGTVENGVFTSTGKTGEAIVQLALDGNVVGEVSINVVNPTAVSFGKEQLVVPYSETVKLKISATVGATEIDYNESDFTATLEDANAGTIEGLSLTAPDASTGITGTTLTVKLNADESVATTINVVYGKGSEVIFDFEEGSQSADADNWVLRTHESKPDWNEQGDISIVNSETGRVHSGEQALALHTDFSQTTCSGANTTGYHALSLGWGGDSVSVKGAQSIGFWLYVPEDAMSTEITLNAWYTDSKGVVQRRTKDGFDDNGELIYTPYWSTKMEGSGWHYVKADFSAFTDDLFIHDEPSYTGGAYKRNFFIKIYAVTGPDTLNFSSHHGDFVYYIDDVTVDYSDAVKDRELPVFSNATVSGGTSSKALAYGQTVEFAEDNAIFNANVSDNTNNTNFTGIDASTAKVYVDGVEVGGKYANGVISSENVELANGYHRVRFEIADNNGNVGYITREFNVTHATDIPTVELVPHDATLDRLLSGSVYWVDLTTDDIATLEKVETTLNLNSINAFELEHMVVNNGFDVTYTSTAVQDVENIAELTFTRNDKALDTDSNVIASIPVRVWESLIHTYAGHSSKTPSYMWTAGNIQFKQVNLYVEKGVATFTNNTTLFSGDIDVDHEGYTHYYNMDTAYHTEKGTYHVHTAQALDDKDATCTESGFTGRTYCDVCDSVVEWGETVKAVGHSYEIGDDGILDCKDCGEKYTGTYEGKEYADGVLVEGWVDDSYYVNGSKLTGVQKVGDYYYDFGDDGVCEGKVKFTGLFKDGDVYRFSKVGVPASGWQIIGTDWYYFESSTMAAANGQLKLGSVTYEFEETGKLVSGVWATTLYGTRYYYGPDFYKNGWQTIDGKKYFFDKGYRLEGGWQIAFENYQYRNWYYFDENGACDEDAVIEDGFYTDRNGLGYAKDGVGLAGIQRIDGKVYYFDHLGYAQKNGTYGGYIFKDDYAAYTGLHTVNGVLYYYENGKTGPCGLVEIDGDYYYSYWGGVIKTDGKYYVDTTYCDLPVGNYTFGKDGKMLDGIVEIDGTKYLYINGVAATHGLYKYDGAYYYSYYGGVLKTDGKYYVDTTYCDLPVGNYTFGKDGKMLDGVVNIDGTDYLYVNGKTATYGLYKVGDDYYYSNWGGVLRTDGRYWVDTTFCDLPKNKNYTFGKDGKMLDGVVDVDGTLYLYDNGTTATCGLVKIDGDYYYSYWGGVLKTDGKYYVDTTYCDLPIGNYTFGKDGKMLNGPCEVDGKLYFYDTGKTATNGLYEFEGSYYYSYWGGVLKTDGRYYVETTFCDMPIGNYQFGEDGKMLDGIVTIDGIQYLYSNGIAATNGLYKVDGDYYYSYWGGVIKTDGKYFVDTTFCDMPVGNYYFGEDGKMLDGFVTKADGIYYYENGKPGKLGLFEYEGDYYFVKNGDGLIVTNQTYYAWETNGLSMEMNYTFDENGRVVL